MAKSSKAKKSKASASVRKKTVGAAASRAKKRTAKKAVKRKKATRRAKTASAGTTASRKKAQKKRAGFAATAKKKTKRSAAKRKKAASSRTHRKKAASAAAKRPVAKKKKIKKAAKKATSKKKALRRTGGRKLTTTSPASLDPIQSRQVKPKLPKTPLKAKELRAFKQLLLNKRMELAGDVDHLTSTALNTKGRGSGQSSMPIHMADLGSDTWEKEFTLGLIASERALVREIDEALERVANKSYGVCMATGVPISMPRLRAKPWAKFCIGYARELEEGRVR